MKRMFFALLLPGLVCSVLQAQTAWEFGNEFVREALRTSPELLAKRADSDIAHQKTRNSLGAMLPSIDFQSRYTRAGGGREITFDVNDFMPPSVLPVDVPTSVIPFLRPEEHETKLSFQQPLFVGGSLYHSWRAQKMALSAEHASLKAREAEIAYRTRAAWFNWLSARELVQVSLEDTLLAAEQLRSASARVEQAMANSAELQRARAALADARANWIDASTREQLALTALNRLLGRPLLREPDVPVLSADLPEEALPLESVLSLARADRGELHQLEQQGRSLGHYQSAATGTFLPTLVAAGEYGYQGEEYKFDNDHDYYTLSLVMKWNLFDGFRKNAKREQVVLQRRQLQDTQHDVELAIEQDVTRAWLNNRSSRMKHAAAEEARLAAAENYRLVKALYDEGMASQVELLDAQTTRTRASTREIAARYGAWIAQADLWRSIGHVFEEDNNE